MKCCNLRHGRRELGCMIGGDVGYVGPGQQPLGRPTPLLPESADVRGS